jgi:hypothetical protein
LSHLVSQANRQRSEQHDHAKLKASIDGPDGMRAKALKHDMLQQAFAAIQRGPAAEQAQANCFGSLTENTTAAGPPRRDSASVNTTAAVIKSTAPVHSSTPSAGGAPVMNPARARLLSAAPSDRDPDRDLYEAPPPPRQPSTRTGSNDVPLGKPRPGWGSSIEHDSSGGGPKRLRHEDETQSYPAKRPRVDVGRAAAMVQSSLQGTATIASNKPANPQPLRPPTINHEWQARFRQLLGRQPPAQTAGTFPADARLLRETSTDSTRPQYLPTVKMGRRLSMRVDAVDRGH